MQATTCSTDAPASASSVSTFVITCSAWAAGIPDVDALAGVQVLRHLTAQVDGFASDHRLAQVVVEPLLRIAVSGVERPDPQVTAYRDRLPHLRTASATSEYLATRSSGPLKS